MIGGTPEVKSKRKVTVEFGDINEPDMSSPEPTIKKQASVKPREFEIKELEVNEIQKTEISSEKIEIKEDESVIEDSLFHFPVSFRLINLLRNPDIDLDTHTFKSGFLENVRDILETFAETKAESKELLKPTGLSQKHFIIYIHLAIAYSSNIENLFNAFKVPLEVAPIAK